MRRATILPRKSPTLTYVPTCLVRFAEIVGYRHSGTTSLVASRFWPLARDGQPGVSYVLLSVTDGVASRMCMGPSRASDEPSTALGFICRPINGEADVSGLMLSDFRPELVEVVT